MLFSAPTTVKIEIPASWSADRASSFYINLPIGVVAPALVALFCADQNNLGTRISSGWRENLQQFDIWGTLVLLPMVVCLLLALQWGGSKYDWSDGRVIAMLVISAVLCLVFVWIQHHLQDWATLPPRVLRYSTVQCAAWVSDHGGVVEDEKANDE
jgi:MFS family permease